MAERRVRHSLGRRVLGRSAAGRVTVTLSISRPGSDCSWASVHSTGSERASGALGLCCMLGREGTP